MGGGDSSLSWSKEVSEQVGRYRRNNRVGSKSCFTSDDVLFLYVVRSCPPFSQRINMIQMVFLKITLLTGYGVDGVGREKPVETSRPEKVTGM